MVFVIFRIFVSLWLFLGYANIGLAGDKLLSMAGGIIKATVS